MTLDILQIFLILRELTENSWLVGGCVRDALIGKVPKDYDIVTDVPMDILESAFKASGWEVKDTGMKFLVLNIAKMFEKTEWGVKGLSKGIITPTSYPTFSFSSGHEHFEIANFRKDGVYSDGRRPDSVEIGDINDDAHRRDFTVNALYQNPFTGEIRDPTGKGLKDIKKRILRFIGDPKARIEEDHLRIFRFYRFLTKGFTPEPRSLRACREMFNSAYPQITPERVRTEVERMVL